MYFEYKFDLLDEFLLPIEEIYKRIDQIIESQKQYNSWNNTCYHLRFKEINNGSKIYEVTIFGDELNE